VTEYDAFAFVEILTFAPCTSAQLLTSLLPAKVETRKLKIEELLPYGYDNSRWPGETAVVIAFSLAWSCDSVSQRLG